MLEVWSRTGKMRWRCWKKLFYTDDLALVSGSHEGLKGKVEVWKEEGGSEGLSVSVKKV